jgi:hypothetical protein
MLAARNKRSDTACVYAGLRWACNLDRTTFELFINRKKLRRPILYVMNEAMRIRIKGAKDTRSRTCSRKREGSSMKIVKNILAGVAVATLVASPAVAAPSARASQGAEETSEMGGGGNLVGIIGALLVVALAAVAAFGGGDDEPVSP